MLRRFHIRTFCLAFALVLALCIPTPHAAAQSATGDVDEEAATKLFEQGQNAHAQGQLAAALKLYEEALKLNPGFPEAEYQRGAALVSLKRYQEAERAYRRAIELRADWPLPHAALGVLIALAADDQASNSRARLNEAESFLKRALELDPANTTALSALADARARAGDVRGALEFLRRATASNTATASLWARRGELERQAGETSAALTSLERALSLDPRDFLARTQRAELRLAANDLAGATEDLRAAETLSLSKNKNSLLRLANLYLRANQKDAALRVLNALDEASKRSPEYLLLASEASGETDANSRQALEQLAQREPRNAVLLARLGAAYRKIDPARSLDYYRRAAELEPANVDYATGYASALVQARRFPEAVVVLRRIIAVAPDTYAAHANLAAALDELKSYAEAIVEYNWLTRARPELAITYYFIGRDHDLLQQYREALAAYETFLQRADRSVNALEIDKVNLRLPLLRDQIKRGRGRKPQSAKP